MIKGKRELEVASYSSFLFLLLSTSKWRLDVILSIKEPIEWMMRLLREFFPDLVPEFCDKLYYYL